jgi:hypothetical protein
MVTTREIIQKLWDAQGYGNIAVYPDGSTALVAPGESGETAGAAPVALLKPIRLVNEFPTIDHAFANPDLNATIEEELKAGGLTVSRGS